MEEFRQAALDYHRHSHPGKLGMQTTEWMGTLRELTLTYSLGAAFPCEAISAAGRHAADSSTESIVRTVAVAAAAAVLNGGDLSAGQAVAYGRCP